RSAAQGIGSTNLMLAGSSASTAQMPMSGRAFKLSAFMLPVLRIMIGFINFCSILFCELIGAARLVQHPAKYLILSHGCRGFLNQSSVFRFKCRRALETGPPTVKGFLVHFVQPHPFVFAERDLKRPPSRTLR